MQELSNDMNETRVELNRYLELTVRMPKEVDIATFEGTFDLVKKISKTVGAVIPMKRKYNLRKPRNGNYKGKKSNWNPERVKKFIADFDGGMAHEKILKKYDLHTEDDVSVYLQKLKYYLVRRWLK